MAKTASISEQSMMPTSGRWTWKDETQNLEFVSNLIGTDKGNKRGGRSKATAVRFHDKNRSNQERGATPSLGSRALGLSKDRASRIGGQRSPRPSKQGSDQHTHVTLDDIKAVAMFMLSEVDVVSPSFEGIYEAPQFDKYLICLLNFFHSFFEKRTHEQKPNPMNIEPSAAEKQYHADLCAKLEIAQQYLGQAYCVLVLGIGMQHQHHMSCGQSRVSSTYKDRDMYETLYSFCTFVVWISFRRREYETIHKELCRIMRSDTFNPAIRIKNAPSESESATGELEEKLVATLADGERVVRQKEKEAETKLSQAEYRRLHGKRPAIKSIINRSPALVSILPLPKEESAWLFKSHKLEDLVHGNAGRDGDTEALIKMLESDPHKVKIGIIGEPFSQFNRITLAPLGTEAEEEGEDKEGGRRDSLGQATPHGDAGMSRQATQMSEAMSEDE